MEWVLRCVGLVGVAKEPQTHYNMKPFITLILGVFFLILIPRVQAVDFLDSANSEDLRLRLTDRVQEKRTTSLNWIDLIENGRNGSAAKKLKAARPGAVRIVIDPGHGGKDLGAQGHYGLSEQDLCLHISHLVRRDLERYGKVKDYPLEVRLTREEDTFLPLRERVRMANEWGADIFLSIHTNSSLSHKPRGFEVYFLNAEATDAEARRLAQLENMGEATPIKDDVVSILNDVRTTQHVSESSRFAETVYQALSRKLRSNTRGVRQAPFAVLSGTFMPSLLVEVGYLSHAEEAKNLKRASYLKRLSGAISTGIIEFITQLRRLG